MKTAVRAQEFIPVNVQTSSTQEPKQLSKVGQWMRDNPKGLFIIVNREAVNQ